MLPSSVVFLIYSFFYHKLPPWFNSIHGSSWKTKPAPVIIIEEYVFQVLSGSWGGPGNYFHSKTNFKTLDKFSEKAYYAEDTGTIRRQTGPILISKGDPLLTRRAQSIPSPSGLSCGSRIDQTKYYGKSTSCFFKFCRQIACFKR